MAKPTEPHGVREPGWTDEWAGQRIRPELDGKESERIMRVLMMSFGMRSAAEFQLYHPFEACAAIGVVDTIDPYVRTFTIDGECFLIDDIIGARMLETA